MNITAATLIDITEQSIELLLIVGIIVAIAIIVSALAASLVFGTGVIALKKMLGTEDAVEDNDTDEHPEFFTDDTEEELVGASVGINSSSDTPKETESQIKHDNGVSYVERTTPLLRSAQRREHNRRIKNSFT